jgi:hypothetical protein
MKHRVILVISLAVLFAANTILTPVSKADMAGLKTLQEMIERDGKLPGGNAYWALARSVYDRNKVSVRGNRIASQASALTTTEEVGEHPGGFGKGFYWARKDEEILLVLFINSADAMGISVAGVERGDRITLSSASGIASFTEDNGNPLASSIVALIAAGTKVGLTLAGAPEAAPAVEAAETFAKEQFKSTNVKHKPRDAFGIDPGTSHKARQEGGIFIALPENGGASYSGKDLLWTKMRWIQGEGDRVDTNLPKHVISGFFPIQGNLSHNTRVLGIDGQIYVVPWDYKFEDNAGYYKVFLHIKRADNNTPPVIQRIRNLN